MSGHSKWSTIKRQKGVADAQRGQLFTKLSKELIIAAKQGGADLASNFRLRLAVQKAKDNNMPNENIERAIKRGVGGGEGADLAEVTYEGFGPSGTAVIVEAATDNRNRTVAEIRSVLTRAGGNLGESGSVAWNFESRGVINVPLNGKDADDLALEAIDAGAEDVQVGDGTMEIFTAPGDLEPVKRALEDKGLKVESAEQSRIAKTTVQLDEKAAIQTLRLVEKLEELDDVQKVYFNAEFDESVLAAYSG